MSLRPYAGTLSDSDMGFLFNIGASGIQKALKTLDSRCKSSRESRRPAQKTKGMTEVLTTGMAKRMTAINQEINAEYIPTDKP